MDVREGELMVCDEWVCEWEERTGGRRWRGGVSYSPPGQTLHVSTPAWLSRSLLWPNIPSIRSGTCILDLVFFFAFYYIGGWSWEVPAMDLVFSVRCKKGNMECMMDLPHFREAELICDW